MTQNHNETFSAMICARIPKSTKVTFSQLQLGVMMLLQISTLAGKQAFLYLKNST